MTEPMVDELRARMERLVPSLCPRHKKALEGLVAVVERAAQLVRDEQVDHAQRWLRFAGSLLAELEQDIASARSAGAGGAL